MTAISAPIVHTPHGTAKPHAGHALHTEHRLSFVKKYLFSTDHKIIGIQFLFFGLLFMLLGGLLAMAVRWQLAWPNESVPGYRPVPVVSSWLWGNKPMPFDRYNEFFSMHATIM